jgi:two-component system cell cycle response regulator
MNVLLIDDSPSDRALIAATLGHAGHNVVSAASSTEGIAQLVNPVQEYDVIVLDVKMPGTDGLETAKQIRALERDGGQQWRPIIFLSGRYNAEDIAAGIEAGGDDYLAKPINSRVLKAKMLAMQRIATMRRELIATQKKLEMQANTDSLTGLANRRHFTQLLNAEMARSTRYDTPLTLAYLDLDHFKQVNDSFGHQAGDDVLRKVAQFFSDTIRSEDFIGRIGGEEFCLCMPGIDIAAAQQACERYRQGIEALRIQSDAFELKVTVSIGLTQLTAADVTIDSLLERADSALYRAKHNGRNQVHIEQTIAHRRI